jgi:phage baseplate assembly protein W
MSEPERKAAARAAYAEGVELQTAHDCARALPKFEAAQRLFDAPTHQLHIAQCQVESGMLVEAQESYSTLSHLTLAPQAPAAFREAKEKGRAELARLSPRVPTLRVTTSPAATTLENVVVQVNGTRMPAELMGVARPLNPGRYQVKVTASPNLSGAGEMELKEGQEKSLEVRLSR